MLEDLSVVRVVHVAHAACAPLCRIAVRERGRKIRSPSLLSAQSGLGRVIRSVADRLDQIATVAWPNTIEQSVDPFCCRDQCVFEGRMPGEDHLLKPPAIVAPRIPTCSAECLCSTPPDRIPFTTKRFDARHPAE